MKRTHRRELLNTIKSSKVSFVSIVFFVALAVAIFVGLSWTGDGTRAAIDRQMEDTHYYDYELIFPYGFTDSDVKQIGNMEGVDELATIKLAYGVYNKDKVDYQVKIQELCNSINTPIVIEGRLPDKVGEVALESDFASRQDIAVGDSIKVIDDEIVDGSKLNKLMDLNADSITANDVYDIDTGYLVTDTFIVTATVESMQYVMDIQNTYGSTLNGAQPVDGLLYMAKESFRENAYSGHTNIYIRSNRLRGMNTYSSEYKNACIKLKDSLTDDIGEIASARFNSIKDKADETTEAIDRELEDALGRINKGKNSLQDAETQLQQLEKKKDKLIKTITEIENQLKSIRASSSPDQTEDPTSVILASKLEDELKKSQDAKKQLDELIASLKKKVELGRGEISRLANVYSDGQEKAGSFKEEVKELTEYDCLIATREYNVGITSLEIVCECIDKIRYSMAMLFLIVGLLVCYSAVSRIIYSQYTRIGIKKAFGMKESEINAFYFAYSGIAVITGIVLGIVIGALFVERVVTASIAKEYLLYSAKMYINWSTAAAIAAVEIALTFLCTWIACYKILRQDAVVLLTGQTPQHNKARFFEKLGVWKRRSLLSKTIVNNFINDKRRVFATLVGIAGCTAMIVCAIMLKDNIVLGFQKQYDELFKFNEIVLFDENSDGADERISSILSENEVSHTFIKKEMATMTLPDGKLISLDIFTSEATEFYDLVKVNQMGDAAGTRQEGVWLTHAYANEYGTKAGDTIELVDSKREIHKLKVTGFMECYLTRGLVLLSPEVYRAEFGADVVNNAALVNIDKTQEKALNKQLKIVDGFYNINDYYKESENFFEAFTSVSGALVAVYMLLATIMTLLVLLNLFVMFVEEKRIELIVMMINGFDVKDAKAYIYRDTIFIGIVGIVVGAVVGTLLGRATIGSFENAATAMIKTTDAMACLIAAIVTVILTTIMVLIAVRRIDKFELADINRE